VESRAASSRVAPTAQPKASPSPTAPVTQKPGIAPTRPPPQRADGPTWTPIATPKAPQAPLATKPSVTLPIAPKPAAPKPDPRPTPSNSPSAIPARPGATPPAPPPQARVAVAPAQAKEVASAKPIELTARSVPLSPEVSGARPPVREAVAHPTPTPEVKVIEFVPPPRVPSVSTGATTHVPPVAVRGDIVEIEVVPAHPVLRIMAWVIDLAVFVAVVALYVRVMRATHRTAMPPPTTETGLDFLADRAVTYRKWIVQGMVLGFGAELTYAAITVAKLGRTLGGWLTGLRVVTSEGRSLGWIRAIWRSLAGGLGAAALLMGFWLAAFLPSRRALHDLLSGTFVVRKTGAMTH
jgi:uncharacterized RDD family membrane protein YckC